MIDTDKYEGHIQDEWRDTIHEGAKAHHIYAGDVNICTVFPNEATANLVTDAPLTACSSTSDCESKTNPMHGRLSLRECGEWWIHSAMIGLTLNKCDRR